MKIKRRKPGHCFSPDGLSRGSMTVEASFVIPIIVIVIAALLTLLFYVHNRCWYTNAALESAMMGNARFTGEDDEGISLEQAGREAENRAEQRAADQTMPGTTPSYDVECGRQGTSVTFQGQKYSMFTKYFNDALIKESVDRIWPAGQIRAARNVRSFAAELSGGE